MRDIVAVRNSTWNCNQTADTDGFFCGLNSMMSTRHKEKTQVRNIDAVEGTVMCHWFPFEAQASTPVSTQVNRSRTASSLIDRWGRFSSSFCLSCLSIIFKSQSWSSVSLKDKYPMMSKKPRSLFNDTRRCSESISRILKYSSNHQDGEKFCQLHNKRCF